jgi:hypothetical protein
MTAPEVVTAESGEGATAPPASSDVEARLSRRRESLERWVDVGSTVILALATVLSAWCAYQSARWGGVQANFYSEAGAARTQAVQQANRANVAQSVDVGMFLQYVAAITENNADLTDFLFARFRPPMKVAMEAWLATTPLQNPEAPPSPFAMPEYVLAEAQEAERLSAVAEEKAQQARDANQTGDNYVLLTVMLASVLFIGAIAGKFGSLGSRLVFLVVAAFVLLAVTGVLATYPIE